GHIHNTCLMEPGDSGGGLFDLEGRLVGIRSYIHQRLSANFDITAVNHPDFKPGFNVLSDHTQIKKSITTKQVQALSSHIQKLKPYLADTRWAVLTAKKSSYGMMRMLSVYLESIPVELEVFYKLEEAEAWLNQKH
ncbi:MAG: hypothetical protein P8X42_10955, partial [Calditrichaceae bacterium]